VSEEGLRQINAALEDDPTLEPTPVEAPSGSPGKWEMPKPVFRKTSGYLPQGFEKQFAAGREDGVTGPPVAVSTPTGSSASPAPAVTAVDVEEQPYISEQFGPGEIAAPTAQTTPKSSAGRIVLIVAGFLALLTFIAVFLAVVYYLFLGPVDVNNL
jgi:hypothetical protein